MSKERWDSKVLMDNEDLTNCAAVYWGMNISVDRPSFKIVARMELVYGNDDDIPSDWDGKHIDRMDILTQSESGTKRRVTFHNMTMRKVENDPENNDDIVTTITLNFEPKYITAEDNT